MTARERENIVVKVCAHVLTLYAYVQVGLPSKSGRTGAIMLVVPNVCGMCLWSPAVDKNNNSVRGIQFCTVSNNVLIPVHAIIFSFV